VLKSVPLIPKTQLKIQLLRHIDIYRIDARITSKEINDSFIFGFIRRSSKMKEVKIVL